MKLNKDISYMARRLKRDEFNRQDRRELVEEACCSVYECIKEKINKSKLVIYLKDGE